MAALTRISDRHMLAGILLVALLARAAAGAWFGNPVAVRTPVPAGQSALNPV